ncbi:hypothetical protein OG625_35620 [Streptomyces sp. NBC_01351]|uniref:hypothetical protein n=1 Tax=Streptomyces sp. NBC_01351 TaxID=2903833 RepID=UPI002E3439A8|nr:hypothetical protein [Streptomyces sp. NBC_01351]
MSESFPPPSEQQPPAEQPPTGPGKSARLVRFVPRGRGARFAAIGAAVVLVGAGAAVVTAVAVSDHHGDRRAVRFEVAHEGGPERGPEGLRKFGPDGPGKVGPEAMRKHREGLPGGVKERGAEGLAPGRGAAPAPIPSLAIGDAAQKAAAAVTGGKVESLRVVGQQGGGSAWLAVVLGPDGVRHAVTVSGTDGTVTGNEQLSGR